MINTFHVAPSEVKALLDAWTADAAYMQDQPGYVSTQLHRGIGGSTTFVNIAQWRSVEDLRNAVSKPEFVARMGEYPASASASPHVFEKVAVEGICGG